MLMRGTLKFTRLRYLLLVSCAGCGTDATPLSALKGRLDLALTADSSGLFVQLTSTDSSSAPSDCPVLDARAFANGIELQQSDTSTDNSQPWLLDDGWDNSPPPCVVAAYGISFHGSPPAALLTPAVALRFTDDSTSFSARFGNLYTTPAFAGDPSVPVQLQAGATTTLALEPEAPGLGAASASVSFYPEPPQTTTSFFGIGSDTSDVVLADDAVTFRVPVVPAADGLLFLSTPALGPSMVECKGFDGCGVKGNLYASISTAATITP